MAIEIQGPSYIHIRKVGAIERGGEHFPNRIVEGLSTRLDPQCSTTRNEMDALRRAQAPFTFLVWDGLGARIFAALYSYAHS